MAAINAIAHAPIVNMLLRKARASDHEWVRIGISLDSFGALGAVMSVMPCLRSGAG